jgi:hypothetical protein
MEDDFTNSMGRLQLFTNEEAVCKGTIPTGHYGIRFQTPAPD